MAAFTGEQKGRTGSIGEQETGEKGVAGQSRALDSKG